MEADQLKYHMKLRIYRSQPNFGPGITTLMQLVKETQSLSGACQRMKMSYSKAWKLIRQAEHDLGIPLLSGSSGGKSGGQTVLTPEGECLLEQYLTFHREARQAVDELFQQHFKDWQ